MTLQVNPDSDQAQADDVRGCPSHAPSVAATAWNERKATVWPSGSVSQSPAPTSCPSRFATIHATTEKPPIARPCATGASDARRAVRNPPAPNPTAMASSVHPVAPVAPRPASPMRMSTNRTAAVIAAATNHPNATHDGRRPPCLLSLALFTRTAGGRPSGCAAP